MRGSSDVSPRKTAVQYFHLNRLLAESAEQAIIALAPRGAKRNVGHVRTNESSV